MRGEYIERRESVILIGHPGTGKTHIATALGIAACGLGKEVGFHRVTELITQLMKAREERQLMRIGGDHTTKIMGKGTTVLSEIAVLLLFPVAAQFV